MTIMLDKEPKRLLLLVIAMISCPICVMGLSLSFFWFNVMINSNIYSTAMFDVKEVGFVRYGSKIRYEVATGAIGGVEEILYSWGDYFQTNHMASEGRGQRLHVMYNPKASYFHFGGRNMRVLSVREYKNAAYMFLKSIAISAIAPMLWFVYFRYYKGNKRTN